MEKIIRPYHFGQQVKSKKRRILSTKYQYVICEVGVHGKNNYDYGIAEISSGGKDAQWWIDHDNLELMLNGKITDKNLEIAFKGIELEDEVELEEVEEDEE